jgi:poly-gamma-glutamate synthesis protein (capsule biosynthesis protein)
LGRVLIATAGLAIASHCVRRIQSRAVFAASEIVARLAAFDAYLAGSFSLAVHPLEAALMHGRVFMFAAVIASLQLGCGGEGDESVDPQSNFRLAIVGQALIEHDPRAYLEDPMSSVVPILSAADAVFTNLEVAVSGPGCSCVPTRNDVFFHGAEPDVLDYLKAVGVSLLALSNNHSWDYGTDGILSTIAEVESRGLIHVGTGGNIGEATAPAYLDLADFRLGLVAMASVNLPPEARATDTRAGINMLEPGDSADWDRNIAAVRTAASASDAVLVYQHFQTDAETGWQESWARATIDAGADIYVGHGEPTLKGVEIYNGGLILYGLGNFIFHTKTELGRYPPDVWQSVIVEVSLGAEGVDEVSFTPVVLDEGMEGPTFFETRGYPEVAAGPLGQAILSRLIEMSNAYGTAIELVDGSAALRVR